MGSAIRRTGAFLILLIFIYAVSGLSHFLYDDEYHNSPDSKNTNCLCPLHSGATKLAASSSNCYLPSTDCSVEIGELSYHVTVVEHIFFPRNARGPPLICLV